jgi:hypothetical protein
MKLDFFVWMLRVDEMMGRLDTSLGNDDDGFKELILRNFNLTVF